MDNFEIVKLNLNDFSKCDNIWDIYKNSELSRQFYNEIKSGNRVTFIYKNLESEDFLGEVSIVFSDEEIYTIKNFRIYLSHLVVKDTYRNNSIGTTLCNYVFDYCKNLDYKEISLAVTLDNFNAIKLYHKLGFSNILAVKNDNHGKYLVLLKKI